MRWGVSFHCDFLVVCDSFDGFSFSGGVCDEGGHEGDARPDCGVYVVVEEVLPFAGGVFCLVGFVGVRLGWQLDGFALRNG